MRSRAGWSPSVLVGREIPGGDPDGRPRSKSAAYGGSSASIMDSPALDARSGASADRHPEVPRLLLTSASTVACRPISGAGVSERDHMIVSEPAAPRLRVADGSLPRSWSGTSPTGRTRSPSSTSSTGSGMPRWQPLGRRPRRPRHDGRPGRDRRGDRDHLWARSHGARANPPAPRGQGNLERPCSVGRRHDRAPHTRIERAGCERLDFPLSVDEFGWTGISHLSRLPRGTLDGYRASCESRTIAFVRPRPFGAAISLPRAERPACAWSSLEVAGGGGARCSYADVVRWPIRAWREMRSAAPGRLSADTLPLAEVAELSARHDPP